MKKRRNRRRVVRPSAASNYDRQADGACFVSAFDNDGARVVEMDPEVLTDGLAEASGIDFYREQMPPHYGGNV